MHTKNKLSMNTNLAHKCNNNLTIEENQTPTFNLASDKQMMSSMPLTSRNHKSPSLHQGLFSTWRNQPEGTPDKKQLNQAFSVKHFDTLQQQRAQP